MTTIRNIYCVGRNYRAHAAELGNDVPDQPMIFTKPTHALAAIDGSTLSLPSNQGEIHYEAELVIHIAKPYTEGISVDEVVDKYALGIDFTLRDVQNVIKKKGQPWLPAKGFLKSAPITAFRPFPGASQLASSNFQLRHNDQVVQDGNISLMIFDLQTIIDYIAKHYGLGPGDIIYTGTPEGVGPVNDGDRLELLWGEESFGAFTVKM